MPKLNKTHLPERLQQRIEQLERGEALEARDINALLNKEQQQALKTAWAAQQALRKQHKQPKTEAAKQAIGWKTIREVRLDIYKQALEAAEDGLLAAIEEEQRKSEVRAARIFMDAYFKAVDEGKNGYIAGDNALVRAGFKPSLRQQARGLNKRDREIRAMEDALLKRFEDEMTPYEREQLELSREHDRTKGK